MPRTRKTKAQKLREMRLNSVPFNELSVLDKSYLKRLDEDKRYSLEIDPYNLYEFDDVHKQFIYYYVQHRNVPLAAKLAGINENKGIDRISGRVRQRKRSRDPGNKSKAKDQIQTARDNPDHRPGAAGDRPGTGGSGSVR